MRSGVYLAVALMGGAAVLGLGMLLRASLPGEARPVGAPAATPAVATISLVGDIMLASGVGTVARSRGASTLFRQVAPIFTADSLTIGNFESAASTRGAPADKTYTFRADPAVLPAMRAAGIDAVSLANNHALDYGRGALLDTLSHLKRARITPVGAGSDSDQAYGAGYFPLRGTSVALVAASRVLPSTSWHAGEARPGIASAYDPDRLYREIRRARARASVVIVYLHWGVERAPMPAPYQRALAQGCIRQGADAVIGSHPHVLQGFEWYRGKLIAYSLGNFIFTNHDKSTVILQLRVEGGAIRAARVIPCRIRRYISAPLTAPGDRQALFQTLQARSFGTRITPDGLIEPR